MISLRNRDGTRFARGDEMCPMSKRFITIEDHITCEATFTFRIRNTSFKKISFVKKQKRFFWRRHPDLNWGIEDLQSSALPLGYGAI